MSIHKLAFACVLNVVLFGAAPAAMAQGVCVDLDWDGTCVYDFGPDDENIIGDNYNRAPRGDNGWGNGADTTNAGSFSGGTATSKGSNGSDRNDRNVPPGLDGKFDGR